MSALLEAPAGVPQGAPADRPRSGRHRRSLARVAVVLAVVVALVVAALVLVPSTVALSTGGTRVDSTAPVVTLPSYGSAGMHLMYYEDGARVRFDVPLRNDGRLPVTVTSAATGLGVMPLVEVRQVEGLPMRLAPGEEGSFRVEAVLAHCRYYHEREVETIDHFVLGVDVLTRHTERTVVLDRPLAVHSPMIVGCHDRKLNRQADNRRDVL